MTVDVFVELSARQDLLVHSAASDTQPMLSPSSHLSLSPSQPTTHSHTSTSSLVQQEITEHRAQDHFIYPPGRVIESKQDNHYRPLQQPSQSLSRTPMKTSFCAAVGLVAAGVSITTASVQATTPVTAQQAITLFNEEDFAFSLGGPEPSALVDGFQLRGVNLNQLAALEGQGISMALVNLGPCAINLPHVHPRATEMLYTIKGNQLRVAFVEENGGGGAVVNDLYQGDVAFFPQGLIHYQQNLDCEPATFLAALNSEDPGVVTITTRFFELPSEAIQASLNFDDPTLKNLIASLPEAPAMAQRQCLQRCGLLDDDDNYSYNYDDGSKH